jgi:hypothetical protein
MITARNYAAAAQYDLLNWAAKAKMVGPALAEDARRVQRFAEAIDGAVHFALPDGGMILDDKLRGLEASDLRLPFPSITVEYYVGHSELSEEAPVHSPRRLLLAEEENPADHPETPGNFGELAIRCSVAYEIDGRWVPALTQAILPCSHQAKEMVLSEDSEVLGEDPGKNPMLAVSFHALCPGALKELVSRVGPEKAVDNVWTDISAEIRALHELLEALSCVNVNIGTHQPEGRSCNVKRVKKGKLPLWETKCLVVDTGDVLEGKTGTRYVGRSGPRQHLRRGHIRRIGDGRNVWVQACVVGAKAKGEIEKSYAVRRAEKQLTRGSNGKL